MHDNVRKICFVNSLLSRHVVPEANRCQGDEREVGGFVQCPVLPTDVNHGSGHDVGEHHAQGDDDGDGDLGGRGLEI